MQLDVREVTGKELGQWDELVAISPQRTIFAQRWWMNIVTGGEARLLGCFAGDSLLAGLPIWPCRTLGVRRLRQPPLTPYWGPLLRPLEGKALTRLGMEMNLLRALAQYLAQWPDLTCTLHPTLTNWLPFYWNGYGQMTRYTYRITDLSAFTAAGKVADESLRRKIRHAQKHGITLTDDVDPEVVAAMFRLTMARQGEDGQQTILRLWPQLAQAARERRCVFTTAALDADGNIHAARAAVWDDRYAYDILGGGDPRFRNSYSSALVLWHVIDNMAARVPGYDFEGSMLEPVERFFRDFGGELCPYLVVDRHTAWPLNAARWLHHSRHTVLQRLSATRQQQRQPEAATPESQSTPTA